jgi:prepilin-type N-terminal cleavage/methylation domain-containing protein
VKDLIILLKIKIYKMKTVNKGFTLIELLVVIAIIGILSSVVLASLTTARTKGQDAAVQQQLSAMRSQAELYYSSQSPNSYGTAGTDCDVTPIFASTGTGGLKALIDGAEKSGATVACDSQGTTWAVSATLPSGAGTFCVDSTGKSASSTISGSTHVCI